jgi:putative GTP pyrophosphokinase
VTPDEARQRFRDEWPHFDAAAKALVPLLKRLCAELGIAASIEARPKDVGSFVKKIYLRGYADPWREVTDKVGARVIVASPKELRRLRAAIEEPLKARKIVDKSDDAREDSLHYPGIHAQIDVPGHSTSDGEPIEAELQLRTRAQDLWCVVSHRLDYKGAVRPAKRTRRRILRLSVLTEMFDQEVETAMNELAADPAYSSARYLHAAEAEYLRFAAEPGNDELSLEVIDLVRHALPDGTDLDAYTAELHDFVAAHAEKIEHIYQQFGLGTEWADQYAYWLFTQPESIMMFHLIETRSLGLAQIVRGTDVESVVANLYAAWGKAMPETAA